MVQPESTSQSLAMPDRPCGCIAGGIKLPDPNDTHRILTANLSNVRTVPLAAQRAKGHGDQDIRGRNHDHDNKLDDSMRIGGSQQGGGSLGQPPGGYEHAGRPLAERMAGPSASASSSRVLGVVSNTVHNRGGAAGLAAAAGKVLNAHVQEPICSMLQAAQQHYRTTHLNDQPVKGLQ